METSLIPERYLTAKEAADYLGFKESTVRAMGHRGDIPSVKIGGARRYTRESLAAWVAEQNPTSAPAAA